MNKQIDTLRFQLTVRGTLDASVDALGEQYWEWEGIESKFDSVCAVHQLDKDDVNQSYFTFLRLQINAPSGQNFAFADTVRFLLHEPSLGTTQVLNTLAKPETGAFGQTLNLVGSKQEISNYLKKETLFFRTQIFVNQTNEPISVSLTAGIEIKGAL